MFSIVFPIVAAALVPQAAATVAPVDEDALCVIVMAAAIPRALRQPNLPPDQRETVESWRSAVAMFTGIITARTPDDAALRAMMEAASAESEKRDAYKAVVACDGRYRAAMRRLQGAVARP
jgi:hypothetical protein